jgi:PmbA protein
MDIKSLIDKIFQEGKKQGMEDMEVYYAGGRSLSLKVFQKELDGYSLSESEGFTSITTSARSLSML